jgi:hypothetical protein
MNNRTAEQSAAIAAAEAAYAARLRKITATIVEPAYETDLRERLVYGSAEREALFDAMVSASDAAVAEATAHRDAIIAANGGPIDVIADLLSLGKMLNLGDD